MERLGELVGTFAGAGLVLVAVVIAMRRRGADAPSPVAVDEGGWVTTSDVAVY